MNETPDNELKTETEIDALCDEFEQILRSGDTPRVEAFVERLDAPDEYRRRLARELILLDRDYRLARGESPSEKDYLLPDAIRSVVADAFEETIEPNSSPNEKTEAATIAPTESTESVLDMATIPPGESPADKVEIGDRIQYFGDYELVDEIARGGMGVVYRAKQISLSRTIALKMILSGQIAGEDEVRRFQLEAEAAANLDHPGIVPIYDIGEHNGRHYFTMKLIEGKTLTEISRQLRGDHDQIIVLVAKIADAIHHAHQRGILHRDLKPGNVLIDVDGQPMVTDFGLARQLESDEGLTQTGAVIGTPGFMSPEQASGKGVTTATDIYSLGAILYELLCGRPPHAKETVLDTLMSVINDEPERPCESDESIPRDLELITLKCLEKDPDKRYTSAADVAADLRSFLADEPLIVRAPSTFEIAKNWVHKNIGNVIWVPIIALAAGVISGYSAWDYTFGDTTQEDQVAMELLSPQRTPLMMSAPSGRVEFGDSIGSMYSFHAIAFVLSMSFLGLLTARYVRTSSRFSDVASGLSVGLLTGLISLIAGLGPVIMLSMMYGSGPQSMAEDLELLTVLATQPSGYENAVLRDYPAAAEIHKNNIASALLRKVNISLRCDSLTGMWIASFVALGLFAGLGVMQTVLAGSMIRAMPFGQAVINYSLFAIAFVVAGFVFSMDFFVWVVSGEHYYVQWLPPVLSFSFACVVMMGIIRRWNGWFVLITFALMGAFANAFFLHTARISPQDAMSVHSSINFAKDRIDRDPTDIGAWAELAHSRSRWGTLLYEIPYTPQAYEEFQTGLEELRALDDPNLAIPKDANLDFRVQFYRAAGAIFIGMGKREDTYAVFKEQIDKFGFDGHTMSMWTQNLAGYGEYDALEELLRSIEFEPQDSAKVVRSKGNVVLWAFEGVRRKRRMTVEELRPWRESIVHSILPLVDDSTADEAEKLTNERNKTLRKWMLGEQVWNLYGPFDLANPINMKSLHSKLPPETQLLEAPESLPPTQTFRTESGTPVWFQINHPEGAGLGWKQENAAALAWTTFEIEEEQRIQFHIRSDDGMKVWIDGKLQFSDPLNGSVFGRTNVHYASLKPGKHVLMLKVTQRNGDWGFSADMFQKDGFPLPAWTIENKPQAK